MEESDLYQIVLNELENGIYDQVLWQKAMDDNNSELMYAEDEYIELRVEQLKQEEILLQSTNPTETGFISKDKPFSLRNISIGIVVLFLFVLAAVFFAYLLHDYFN